MSEVAPQAELSGVLETCLYHAAAEAEEMERFYTEVLGLRPVSRWPGGLALRLGPGVLLLFAREALAGRRGPISDHGTTGPGHVCLVCARPPGLAEWRSRLAAAGVEIAHEHEWDGGRRSLYFTDPAGNLIEIAGADLWPA